MTTSHTFGVIRQLLIISLLIALCSACVPITSTKVGTEERAINGNIDIDIIDNTFTPSGIGTIQFGTSTMTDARARAIAETQGFKYIDWRPCTGHLQHCAVFQVEGQRGNVFEYHVADQRCMTIHPEALMPGTTLDRVSAPEEGGATDCFAGYTTMWRVREENSYYTDADSYFLIIKHIYQVLQDKRWTDTLTVLSDTWLTPVSGTGMTNKGYSTVILDSTGITLTEASLDADMIASSGSGTEGSSIAKRCEDLANSEKAWMDVGSQAIFTACERIPGPKCSESKISFMLFDLGAAWEGSRCLETCTNIKDTLTQVADAVTNDQINDCKENPGRYFEDENPPVAGDFIPDDGIIKPLEYEFIEFEDPSSCPLFKTDLYPQIAGGMECILFVPKQCEKDSNGMCKCKVDERTGSNIALVCTDVR